MTINKIASEIAKKEGKKSQARIGDIREILVILSDIVFERGEFVWSVFYDHGAKRAKKKAAAEKKK